MMTRTYSNGTPAAFFAWCRQLTSNTDLEIDAKTLALTVGTTSGRFGREMQPHYPGLARNLDLDLADVRALFDVLTGSGWLTVVEPGDIGVAPTFDISFPAAAGDAS